MGLSHSPKIVTSGLVLYLDAANPRSYSGTGTTWTDLSGNGNNGTINLGEYVSSPNGGFLRNVNNTSDFFYVDIPNSTSISNTFSVTTGGWTIEEIIWTNSVVYPEADAGGVGSNPAYSPGATGFDWNHGTTNTSFQFGQSSNAASAYEDNGSFAVDSPYNSLNTWRIRTMIWNRGSNLNSLYINGTFINSLSTPNTSGTAIYDGGGIVFGTLYGWKHYGRRAAIKIYNGVLSATDVLQNYNAIKSRFGL
jgi:hypothetical protein